MMNTIFAVAVLGGLGGLFGLILAISSRVFAVEEDERLAPLTEMLPGANCGACGFAGCASYAQAVIEGTAPVGGCPVGGEETAINMAKLMGVTELKSTRKIAQVQCAGGGTDHTRYIYVGIHDCLTASRLAGGGHLECRFGCLGFGTCVKVCKFDTITVENGVAVVDKEACKGCNKCMEICPRGIITMIDHKSQVTIPCNSRAKGADTRRVCKDGCIACGLCAKACPQEAITIENNLATIDYEKCVSCGLCVDKCPRKLIKQSSSASET